MQPTKPSKENNDPLAADYEESSGEMPVDNKSVVPGFNFITGIFFMLIVIQILRINKKMFNHRRFPPILLAISLTIPDLTPFLSTSPSPLTFHHDFG